jgi:hypothetical protein
MNGSSVSNDTMVKALCSNLIAKQLTASSTTTFLICFFTTESYATLD